jgi:hypothetical protein
MPRRHFQLPVVLRNVHASLWGHADDALQIFEDSHMTRTLFAGLALLAVSITPASAAMDCGSMLDKATAEINKMTKAPSEKRAALTRMAISGYDNCMVGDISTAEKYFKMIMSAGN